MRLSRLLPALILGALTLPAAADAATMTLDRQCFVNAGLAGNQPIVVSASGLTAGHQYNVGYSVNGGTGETGYAYGVADAAGNITLSIDSYFAGGSFEPFVGSATIVLRDSSASGAVVASVQTPVSNATLSAKGKALKARWHVTGLAALTGGTTYYAHYFKGSKKKGSQKLGTAYGPCGEWKGKRPLTPFRKIGNWDVRVTTTKHFSAADLYLKGRVYTYFK